RLHADPLRQSDGADDGRDAEPHLRHAELGVVGREHEVQAATSVSPYPRQWPLTAAMVGFHTSSPDSKELMGGISQNDPGHVPAAAAPSCRSAPTQNERPAPVTMATHASSSARNASQAAFRSWRSWPLMAFSFSGRL